ncbi:branched-chain amino acid transport system permease protein [Anaerosphaera aminiphila DSM 21120]|uniref:Branched-chain amino acid transport system permease protein n=1 Tax=Anaerosphaera aminiphila DSM 21120 TaxID=1120995 RepID=A0A1M5T266_9FIRM|nr:branched-chain amino acid ABC transporter permease [Anaerosphaera aminiphila]SHH44817.1 branched-chain amino acid transport system permease protein [Anaerosphaera aminiphila DSM 21120]
MTRQKKGIYVLTVILLVVFYLVIMGLNKLGVLNSYAISILRLVCINIVLAVSLNITVGNLGQITLGHAGFMSIGAYSAAIFAKMGILPGIPGYIVGLLLGGVLACLVGILIGIPTLRLKGDYLAIVTLAFGEIIRVLIEYFKFTGGAQGIGGIPRVQSFGILFAIMCISVALMFSVMTSRHGRAVLSIRENEIAAQSSGINVTYYKTFAFALSAFFAGIAGAMYAHNLGFVGAKDFGYNKSFDILVMVVLGGMGSFTGAIFSSTALTIIPEMLRQFSDYRMIVYSLLLIMMMIFRPEGLLGRKEFSITGLVNSLVNRASRRRGDKS